MTTIDSLESRVESLVGEPGKIRAPRGPELNARSWSTEAPLRMLLNSVSLGFASMALPSACAKGNA